jgi:hypothetical protein
MSNQDEWQARLTALGDTLGQDLITAVEPVITASIKHILDQLSALRRLLLYFNSQPDWAGILKIVLDTLGADAAQAVVVEGLDGLSYYMLPDGQQLDEDFARLLHDGLTIDDHLPNGAVRLGVLMAVNEDLLGILMIMRYNGQPFTDYERMLLTTFADELGMTLHSLALYKLLREQADRLAGMVRQNE